MFESSIFKWIAGILASVISALIVWNLTNTNGIFRKNTEAVIESKNPVLRITAFDIKQPLIIQNRYLNSTEGSITVFNAGNDIATNCKITWECPPNRVNIKQPEEFSLLAGENKTLIIHSPYFSEGGHYDCTITVRCTNCLPESIIRNIQIIEDFEDNLTQ